ncbi:hypothetical protein BU14_0212s0024 [Porphyra umbilicalis]|uniref:Proteasome assembly chaperone 3 n=1 Tax=Porphyra umbilicalis TaxID=2786 RepID=A0A1X6P581_PORUM|nr:hypothetical protein BU14_0212s0024 [Porphyra umbilicalis]|eukprot:OSX76004.1 hypothetical protein BU14_0212s0024 [Porphyra umbilicalis]
MFDADCCCLHATRHRRGRLTPPPAVCAAPPRRNGHPLPPTPRAVADFPIDVSGADARHPARAAVSAVAAIGGAPTAFLAQPFADTVVVVVTQRGRLGSVWSATTSTADGLDRGGAGGGGGGGTGGPPPVVDVAVLLGARADGVAVLVRAVAALLGGRPLLMTVALGADVGAAVVREVVAVLRGMLGSSA